MDVVFEAVLPLEVVADVVGRPQPEAEGANDQFSTLLAGAALQVTTVVVIATRGALDALGPVVGTSTGERVHTLHASGAMELKQQQKRNINAHYKTELTAP